MAAGLGFKTFTTGEVLTAADTNGYLMQGINVFASTAARDAAITSPQEGQFAYTKDTNSLWYYTGSAWAASGATGDIEGVTAGTGISGGGTSGTVTITNSMATEIAAKGDLIVGTGAATFDNLPVGSNNQILVADSTASTGLKWATPAASTPTFVGCSIFNNANQSIPNATGTVITFNSEQFDTDGFHSTTTNTGRISIPAGKEGKYLLTAVVRWSSSSTSGRRLIELYNSSVLVLTTELPAATSDPTSVISTIVNATATEYFYLTAYQSSGGALNILSNASPEVNFKCAYLGA